MKLVFAEQAWEDYLYWHQHARKTVERIHELFRDAMRDAMREPFAGIGKPEPLKHALSGYWSRRISSEHRMVYKVADGALLIAQLRFHY